MKIKFFELNRLSQFFLIAISLASIVRFYDLNSPWRSKGHYNYGGVHTSIMVNCFEKIPLEESKGIPIQDCKDPKNLIFYPNHPPALIGAEWAWSKIFGFNEGSIRSFIILFSLLNILMVFLIARKLDFTFESSLFASFLQATFPGTLFFSSHADFVCEFAVFWVLLAAYYLFSNKPHRAGFFTVLAGVVSWLGYLNFLSLLVYQKINKRKIFPIILWGFIGFVVGLSMMMWLQQTFDLTTFLKAKLVKPGYVPISAKEQFYFLRWLYMAWQYQNILLGPLFFLLLIFSLVKLKVKENWKFLITILVIAGPGILDMIPGHEYFYIHEFDYMYFLPGYAILIAKVIDINNFKLSKSAWWVVVLILCTYTYGRLQSNFYHDALNSLIMIGSLIYFVFLAINQKLKNRLVLLLGLTAFVNTSQMINWRNEPKISYDFCQRAKSEFLQTGKTVVADIERDFTRDFYCEGIPVVEGK